MTHDGQLAHVNRSFTLSDHTAAVTSQAANRTYRPTTFLERGASVPFTTPMLAGTNVRPAERLGLELIVPNPAGGRGNYILPWSDLTSLCRPTVHDSQLTERIAALHSVTPTSVRRAAKEIASQGFAGRAASGAAVAALASERESLVVTNFQLLLRLVQQEEPPTSAGVPLEAERSAEIERRVKRTIARIAPRLGQDAETVAASLEHLAELYDPIGLGPRATPARLPHAVATLKLMRQEAASLPTDADEVAPALLQMLVATADVTLDLAEGALAEARGLASQVTGLLTAWRTDPAALNRQLLRADWLMDGWERVCQLWSLDPRPVARRDALDEIASLLPIIPREVGDWVGFHAEMPSIVHLRRLIPGHHDWRTGKCVHDMIARNEALLAA